MKLYEHVCPAVFVKRPNRFVAICLVEGVETVVHVKNTGRCRELLLPGCTVYLAESDNPNRKTRYDLVAVESRGYLVNMDSQAPNKVAAEWLKAGGLGAMEALRSEVKQGDSRFDFGFTQEGKVGFAEVKGVTLFDEANMAAFPDAPTERGVKHLQGLQKVAEGGGRACVLFVIQREQVVGVRPHDETHPAFGAALRQAVAAGVEAYGLVCSVTPTEMTITHQVPVIL